MSERVVLMMEMIMMLNGDLAVPSQRNILSNLKSTWLAAAYYYWRFSSNTLLPATRHTGRNTLATSFDHRGIHKYSHSPSI
jgi:hypothetical protein